MAKMFLDLPLMVPDLPLIMLIILILKIKTTMSKKKEIWKTILNVIVAAITSVLTALNV